MKMKIFKMNDCDFVAAENIDDAKRALAELLADGVVTPEFEAEYIDDPHEISNAAYDNLKLTDEDEMHEALDKLPEIRSQGEFRSCVDKYVASCPTFREALNKMVAAGETFPCHFASSEC